MTKEEILRNHWVNKTNKPFDETTKQHLSYVLDAMDEFAKHEVAKFISSNLPVMHQLVCDRCGCHPTVLYNTEKGRFCISCKPAN